MKQNPRSTSAVPSPSTRSTSRTSRQAPRTAGQVSILIADDSAVMLKTLAQVLAGEPNFRLLGTATDGRQAVMLAVALKPELVLMDYRMPYLDGMEATRRLKQHDDPPRIIIVTSDDSPGCRALAKAVGADGFLVKSADLQVQLPKLLRELFALPPPEPCVVQLKPNPVARPAAADPDCTKTFE